MNVAPDVHDSQVRAAALTLHALPEADRVWVLERLQQPQRRLMTGLLEELAALRIPADPALVQSAIESAGLTVPAAAAVDVDQPLTPAAVAALLSHEPQAVVIATLHSLGRADADAAWRHLAQAGHGAADTAWADLPPPPPAVRDALRRALSTLADRGDPSAIPRNHP